MSFVACFSSASLGVMEITIGQIIHENNYIVVIQMWGLQTKSGCCTNTVQTRQKSGELITWEVL